MLRSPFAFIVLCALTRLAAVVPAGAQDVPSSTEPSASVSSFVVVVHPSNPLRSLTIDRIAALFLGKQDEWQDGEAVEPVDLPEASAVRRGFSIAILGRSVESVHAYWQTMATAGRGGQPRIAPDSTAAIAFVRDHPGAVAYVSADTPLEGVKILGIRE